MSGGLGLVLGGGGARTFAHIGVLRAFSDAGVKIDFIGGCSGGAIFAAQHALGWSPRDIRDAAWEHFVARGSLIKATFPLRSLISERPFTRMLEGIFGDARISDTRIPYFCVSTNLTRGETHVHRSGLVRDAVRASMSVPGLAPPAVRDGEIFVDGCVLNAMPVATMRSFGASTVIGVDVSASRGPEVKRGKLPYWWDVMLSAALLGAQRDTSAADVVIKPDLSGSGFLDFARMDEFAAIAYDATRSALSAVKPLTARNKRPQRMTEIRRQSQTVSGSNRR